MVDPLPPEGPPGANSRAGKSYASRGGPRRPYVARLPEATYESLMEASLATGVSANALVAEALETYLSGPDFSRRLTQSADRSTERDSRTEQAARRQREAIERLSGR